MSLPVSLIRSLRYPSVPGLPSSSTASTSTLSQAPRHVAPSGQRRSSSNSPPPRPPPSPSPPSNDDKNKHAVAVSTSRVPNLRRRADKAAAKEKGGAIAKTGGKRQDLASLYPSQTKSVEDPTYNFHPHSALLQDFDERILPYRQKTATELAIQTEPQTEIKSLLRDFIEDHLYNPTYGYFSTSNLEIFSSAKDTGYDFSQFKSPFKFEDAVGTRYAEMLEEAAKKAKEEGTSIEEAQKGGKQIWHTPTEMFDPYFGRTVARAVVSDYESRYYPYSDLVIYEVGAGNGTLMVNILDYIREEKPEVYERTKYRIIEISPVLAGKQKAKLLARGHPEEMVEIINKSIFDWDETVNDPCYFLAMEVFDNFPHDMVRYDLATNLPLQAVVYTDPTGDFTTLYEPVTDPLILQYLSLRALLPPPHNHPPAVSSLLAASPLMRKIRQGLPFAPNLSEPEYIPTKAMQFFETLRDRFPKHRLMMADFHELPDSIRGHNAPVVQTSHKGEMIPVGTYMVRQGFFDIFFPTDFYKTLYMYYLLQSIPSPLPKPTYEQLYTPLYNPSLLSTTFNPRSPLPSTYFSSHPREYPDQVPIPSHTELNDMVEKGPIRIFSHAQFCKRFASREDLKKTEVKDGTNVMLRFYENASVMF